MDYQAEGARLREEREAKLEAVEREYDGRLARLALERLEEAAQVFRERFPKRELRVYFGNGTDLLTVDGRTVSEPQSKWWNHVYTDDLFEPGAFIAVTRQSYGVGTRAPFFTFLTEAMAEVREMCDYYEAAVPEDHTWPAR